MVTMQRTTLSYIFLSCFVTTIFFLQWWQQTSYALALAICGVIGLVLLLFRKRTWSQCLFASIVGLTLALSAVARTTHETLPTSIDAFANKTYVTVRGVIVAEPDRRPMQTKYTIGTTEIVQSGSTIPVDGKLLITDKRQWPEFKYGDSVEVSGVLEKPGAIETFHYDRYLSRYGIYAVMYRARIQKAEQMHDIPIFRALGLLFNWKARFEAQTNRLYPEPHASFMAGLLTGSRRGIPKELMEDFNTTGLTHIIAISGYNITIVITIITALLFWLPFQWRLFPAIAAIIGFTLFVGASAAVVRAAIMGILGLLALHTGRQSLVRLTVLWTLFFMLCWNPKYLWYDAGFQLSFLAVLGLVELAPMLDKLFAKVPQTLGIREALQMTCAAQLSAVPLIVLLFGRFSIIAPIANVLVAPFIPLAMLFGFLGTVLSVPSFFVGQLLAYIGWACLEAIVLITTILANVPYASVDTPKIGKITIVVYYVILVSWITIRTRARSS